VRAPYGPSLNKFATCVCDDLKGGEEYTNSEASNACGIGYRTVRGYVENAQNIHDVNIAIAEMCGRGIKGEEIQRNYPGFKVYASRKETSDQDLCTAEPASETNRKSYIPPDLLPRRFHPLNENGAANHVADVLSVGRKKLKGTLHVEPFLAYNRRARLSGIFVDMDGIQ
jgi:hypothetical protein